jgi:hypothetical protein
MGCTFNHKYLNSNKALLSIMRFYADLIGWEMLDWQNFTWQYMRGMGVSFEKNIL